MARSAESVGGDSTRESTTLAWFATGLAWAVVALQMYGLFLEKEGKAISDLLAGKVQLEFWAKAVAIVLGAIVASLATAHSTKQTINNIENKTKNVQNTKNKNITNINKTLHYSTVDISQLEEMINQHSDGLGTLFKRLLEDTTAREQKAIAALLTEALERERTAQSPIVNLKLEHFDKAKSLLEHALFTKVNELESQLQMERASLERDLSSARADLDAMLAERADEKLVLQRKERELATALFEHQRMSAVLMRAKDFIRRVFQMSKEAQEFEDQSQTSGLSGEGP